MEDMSRQFQESVLFPVIRRGMGLFNNTVILSEDDCSLLYKFGIKQSVIPIIWEGIRDLDISPEWKEKFNRTSIIDIRNYLMRDYALNQIAAALNEAQIPYIFLKGSVLRKLYPEEWMRTSCDIDVLVPENEVYKAAEQIEEKTDFVFRKRNYHDISMTSSHLYLELHFNLKEHMDNIDKLLEHVWDYAVPADDGNEYVLTSEFQLFHVIAHMSYHMVHGGLGIRPFLDLWLLRKKTDYDENIVRRMCADCGILTFYEKCCRLADTWMAGQTVSDDLSILESYILSGGVFGNTENALASKRRKHNIINYMIRRVFMERSLLESEYPEMKDKPYLAPLCQMKRWSRLINQKKRSQIRREINGIRSMNTETIESFDQLLTSLGL